MNEYGLQIVAGLKLLTIAVFATLYGWGGINYKPIRRIGGSLFLTGMICLFSLWLQTFSYWYILCALLYWAALSIGYGAEDTKTKVIKRTYCGLAYACASLPIAIVNGAWILLALHTLLCLSVSVILGVTNPVQSRSEETIIGATIGLLPMYMV